MEQNFYDILGVESSADLEEIKHAYRSLARKYHPDGNNAESSELLFRKISEAYSTLSSSERRERYNLSIGLNSDGKTIEQKRNYVFSADDLPLDEEREGPRPGDRVQRPDDSPEEDVGGILNRITRVFSRPTSSEKEPKSPERTEHTSSNEEVDLRGDRVYHFTINALESLQGTSRELALRGESTPRILKVKIPPGVCSGDLLRVKLDIDGESVSIPVRISIDPHSQVLRDGQDIILRVPITFAEALRGVDLEVPTLGTPVKVKVPPLWDVSKRLRVKGRGVSRPGTEGAGDLYVQLEIVAPDREPPGITQIADSLSSSYTTHPRKNFPKKFTS